MVYNLKIKDKLDNAYNVNIDFSEKKFINIKILNGTEVAFLFGNLEGFRFKIEALYVYKNFRGLGIASSILDILYAFLQDKIMTVVGDFLPTTMEGEKDLERIEKLDRIFYQKNGFIITHNLVMRTVTPGDSSYIFENNELKKIEHKLINE